jgi:site-specific recombinase XerD
MLTIYFKSPRSLERFRLSLVGPYLDDFVVWLQGKGYSRTGVCRRVGEVVHFANWATKQGLDVQRLDQVSLDKLRCQFAEHKILRQPNEQVNRVYRSARIFVSFLEEIDIVTRCVPPATAESPILLREFNEWMQTQRGTLDSTLARYQVPITQLLQKVGSEPKAFTAKGLREFLIEQTKHSGSAKSKKLSTAIRMFLRFLIARGDCVSGLDHAIPPVASWRLSSLPKYLATKDVERLINSCNQSVPSGTRDRAILLLIARLGLRAGDVSGLKFGDIRWTEGTLVVSGKNRKETRLPLPQEVGEAILDYLKHGRPPVASNRVFITALAPFIPVTRFVVGQAVARALHRTGITSHTRGARLLRHSAATSLLNDGISLPAIGALLRHSSIDTTRVYAKVDFASLKELAMPWPEVQSC